MNSTVQQISSQEYVDYYFSKDLHLIQLAYEHKVPIAGSRFETRQPRQSFKGDYINLGIYWGETSHYWFDLDFDDAHAADLADKVLPPTITYGRKSCPQSHRLYKCSHAHNKIFPNKYAEPLKLHHSNIIEIKANKVFSMVPGSTWRSTSTPYRREQVLFTNSGLPQDDPFEVTDWPAFYAQLEAIVEAVHQYYRTKHPAETAAYDATHSNGSNKNGLQPSPQINSAAPIFAQGTEGTPTLPPPTLEYGIYLCRKHIKERCRESIDGANGSASLFFIFAEGWRHCLPYNEIYKIGVEYNDSGLCKPRWSEKELAHKIIDAKKRVLADNQWGIPYGAAAPPPGVELVAAPILLDTSPPLPTAAAVAEVGEAALGSLSKVLTASTEASAAEFFAARYQSEIRFETKSGVWFAYDGKCWHGSDKDSYSSLTTRLHHATQAIYTSAIPVVGTLYSNKQHAEASSLLNFAKRICTAQAYRSIPQIAKGFPQLWINSNQLDSHPYLLNLPNGTLNLQTGLLQPHDRNDYLTKLCPVEFDPIATCPRWLQFLNEIFNSDTTIISYMQRFCGYLITSDVSQQILPIFHGMGANGKSVFIATLHALLGDDYAMYATSDLLLIKRSDSHPTELADLRGKRLVACVETEAGRYLSETLVKLLTGGEGGVRARHLWENNSEFNPTHKFIIASNHQPNVRGTDFAIWRRLRLVPFTVTIPPEQQDRDLSAKLALELPGILNWALAGCRAYLAHGLGEPETITTATNAYRASQDVLGAFLGECITQGKKLPLIACGEVYAVKSAWCRVNNFRLDNAAVFGRRMAERGFIARKAHGIMVYDGMALTPYGETLKSLSLNVTPPRIDC